jgi:hypothetical protein
MTTDLDASMPRWGKMTEPTTVITNAVLSVVALVLGVRLAYYSAANGIVSAAAIAFGLLTTSFAAALGAAAHGIDPLVDRAQRDRCWNLALAMTGLIGASCIVAVAFLAARGAARTVILVLAGIKLVAFVVSLVWSWRNTASRRSEAPGETRWRMDFRVAAAEYGAGLVVLGLGAVYAWVRWRTPGSRWLIGSILISLVGGLVQARRLGLHRHFNHNDLYHVIQTFALYAFYRGGARLVDR